MIDYLQIHVLLVLNGINFLAENCDEVGKESLVEILGHLRNRPEREILLGKLQHLVKDEPVPNGAV